MLCSSLFKWSPWRGSDHLSCSCFLLALMLVWLVKTESATHVTVEQIESKVISKYHLRNYLLNTWNLNEFNLLPCDQDEPFKSNFRVNHLSLWWVEFELTVILGFSYIGTGSKGARSNAIIIPPCYLDRRQYWTKFRRCFRKSQGLDSSQVKSSQLKLNSSKWQINVSFIQFGVVNQVEMISPNVDHVVLGNTRTYWR